MFFNDAGIKVAHQQNQQSVHLTHKDITSIHLFMRNLLSLMASV
jgi:hypothetical protein